MVSRERAARKKGRVKETRGVFPSRENSRHRKRERRASAWRWPGSISYAELRYIPRAPGGSRRSAAIRTNRGRFVPRDNRIKFHRRFRPSFAISPLRVLLCPFVYNRDVCNRNLMDCYDCNFASSSLKYAPRIFIRIVNAVVDSSVYKFR